jgi:ferredoxin
MQPFKVENSALGPENETQDKINPDECIDCGNCANVCAQNAIFAESDLPADKAHFAEKNRAYFN